MNNETDLEIYFLSLLNSLVIDGEVTDEYDEILDNMSVLLSDNLSLYGILNNSKFLTYHSMIFLKNDDSLNAILNFLSKNFDHLNLPEIFFTKKFAFFITDKLYEKLYDDYSPNLDFVCKMVGSYESFIGLLYDCGYFCLLNGIIDNKTCKIYNTIFKDRVYNSKDTNKIKLNSKDCFYEIQRKQFDNEIIFNEDNLIKFKNFTKHKQGTSVHNKIYEGLITTSMYNLILCDFNEMDCVINYKKNDFWFILDNEDLLNGCYEKKPNYLRMIRNYYKDFKYLNDIGFYKKISKFLDDKDFSLRYEVLLILCQYENLSINFSEKKIRNIFEILEYKIDECTNCKGDACKGECTLNIILDLLYKIYTETRKDFFYKISYLILLRELNIRIGHIFFYEYFRDLILYFRDNKNNISRVLFPYQKKRTQNENKRSYDVNERLYDENDSENELHKINF
ncbi:hypothetical protein P3W45_000744 [Vairimorpha bombi]|jgi:hypothetical protein